MKKGDEVGFAYLIRDCIREICVICGWFELRNSGLTGVKLPRATLDWEARRQGLRAQAQRDQLNEQMQTPQADLQKVHNVQTERLLTPFTLVIQLDAWNIRERDD
jgi:hypothetical protein